jgi:hypothetical protein
MTFQPDYIDPDDALLSGTNTCEYTVGDLKLALRRIKVLEAEIAQLRAPLRPSLEVLQRMANGIDPFDIGRFKCATAALEHETPKLTASVSMTGNLGIADRLDAFNSRRKAEARGLRVIDAAEPEPA